MVAGEECFAAVSVDILSKLSELLFDLDPLLSMVDICEVTELGLSSMVGGSLYSDAGRFGILAVGLELVSVVLTLVLSKEDVSTATLGNSLDFSWLITGSFAIRLLCLPTNLAHLAKS